LTGSGLVRSVGLLEIVFEIPAEVFLFVRGEGELDSGLGLKVRGGMTLEGQCNGVFPFVEGALPNV